MESVQLDMIKSWKMREKFCKKNSIYFFKSQYNRPLTESSRLSKALRVPYLQKGVREVVW